MNFTSVYLKEFDQVYCDDDEEENIFDLRDPLKALWDPRRKSLDCGLRAFVQTNVTHFCDDQQGAACRLLLTDPTGNKPTTFTPAVSLSQVIRHPLSIASRLERETSKSCSGELPGRPQAGSNAGRVVGTTSHLKS